MAYTFRLVIAVGLLFAADLALGNQHRDDLTFAAGLEFGAGITVDSDERSGRRVGSANLVIGAQRRQGWGYSLDLRKTNALSSGQHLPFSRQEFGTVGLRVHYRAWRMHASFGLGYGSAFREHKHTRRHQSESPVRERLYDVVQPNFSLGLEIIAGKACTLELTGGLMSIVPTSESIHSQGVLHMQTAGLSLNFFPALAELSTTGIEGRISFADRLMLEIFSEILVRGIVNALTY